MIKRFGILSFTAAGLYSILFLLIGVPYLWNLDWSWVTLSHSLGYLVFLFILLLFIGVNGYFAFLFLKSKQIDSYKEKGISRSLLVFFLSLLPLLFFSGYLFVNHILLYVFVTLGIVLFIQFIIPFRKRLGIVVLVFLFFVLGIGVLNGFEEGYCAQKGQEADTSAKVHFISSNSYERNVFPKTKTIAVWLHTELQCEDTFNAVQAFKDFKFWTL